MITFGLEEFKDRGRVWVNVVVAICSAKVTAVMATTVVYQYRYTT
jgi:hypothetical protein